VRGRRTAVVSNPYDLAKFMFHGHFRNPARALPVTLDRPRLLANRPGKRYCYSANTSSIANDWYPRRGL